MADDVKVSKFSSFGKNAVKFFKDVRSELKKVIWPNRAQLTNNTATVLLSCIIVGAIIWSFDIGLEKLVKLFLIK
ncbi:MAG: preprotein translocase subunit SecE [Clostridia bacterium]|nr:preprotein translocase subunit SecE [Clostridia bacterium]